MTRVLLVGLQPEAVDYSDPALPPGMDAEKIQAGIEQGLKKITDRGWQADTCLIQLFTKINAAYAWVHYGRI